MTLMRLERTLTETVNQIQNEIEILFDQLSRMQDLEEGEIKHEKELTSPFLELSKMENESLKEKSEKSNFKLKEDQILSLEKQAIDSEETARALRNLFDNK